MKFITMYTRLIFCLFLLLELAKSKIIPLVDLFNQRRQPLSPEGQCSLELWKLERQLRQSSFPLHLDGHWVSSKCEILPGPIFQLRDYQFYETGSFMMRQYQYVDSQCSKPKQAYIARGKLNYISRSWAVPGANEATVQLDTLNIIPYTKKAAKALTLSLRRSCQVEEGKPFPWPWLEQYRQVLVHQVARDDPADGNLAPGETDEISCSHAVNFTASELTLLRMDEVQMEDNDFFFKRLYLGLPIWDSKENVQRRPSHFQVPLINADELVDCEICEKVADANRLTPPKLRPIKKNLPHKPAHYLEGDWLSSECESHINGMFIHRQLTFLSSSNLWSLRQRMYDDSLCRHPAYTLMADGNYETSDKMSNQLSNSQEISFHVQHVKLVPESRTMTRNLRHADHCAHKHLWHKDRLIDLTEFGGCLALGIRVPTTVQDIIRIEQINSRFVLYTGDFATTDYSGAPRPTSFRAPMTKCDQMTVVVSLSTDETPFDSRQRYMLWRSNASTRCADFVFVFFVVLLAFIVRNE